MYNITDGTFEVQEQSLYRALRRFKGMDMVSITEEESPGSGPKRKFYFLTPIGHSILARFIELHIDPLMKPETKKLFTTIPKGAFPHES